MLIYYPFSSYCKLDKHLLLIQEQSLEGQNKNLIIITMKEQTKLTYGLKNASAFLQKLKREKECEHNFSNDTANEKEQTFDECQIPSSRESPQQRNKSKQMFDNAEKRKKEDKNSTPNQIQKVGLADMIIREHLKSTLQIYNNDLLQLQQNRNNLVFVIQEICSKLKALTDQQNKNQMMELQNFKKKKEIQFLLRQYHQSKLNLERKKVQISENFIKKKEKIKTLLDLYQIDSEYIVQVDSWKFYHHSLLQNKNINAQISDEQKVLDVICPKIEETSIQNNKKKQKSKVVDKSGLLGDLKNFAKNFKIPNN